MEGNEKLPTEIDIKIDLNWDDYPEETELIYNMIKAGNISSFIYVTIADIVTGKYNMQESQTQNLLDNVVKTVTSIYQAMTGLDDNVLDLVKVVNSQADIYSKLQEKVNFTEKIEYGQEKEITPITPITLKPEDIDLDTSSDKNEDLDVDGLDSLFLL